MNRLKKTLTRGMTLVEITIVLTVLLVIFGAVFLFFSKGTEQFDYARRQNELITIGRLALEEVTDIIIYAGYMPVTNWDNDDWHPVVFADSLDFEFYADWEGTGTLLDSDYRQITLSDGHFLVTDRTGYSKLIGSNIDSLNFNYMDEIGNPLPEPLSESDRDLVRHIQIIATLGDTWGNMEYQTNVSTTISPRNLGLNHNINPAFSTPELLEGHVVFNVPGIDTVGVPNPDELLMINMMIDWGLTVTILTDDQMTTYDFLTEDVDLIILRHRSLLEVFPHPDVLYNNPTHGDTLQIPVVTLNARDASDIFLMGVVPLEQMNLLMTPANSWHPVNRDLPMGDSTFNLYEPFSTGMQSVLDSLIFPGGEFDTVLTYSQNMSNLAGVFVKHDGTSKRRVLYSGYDATEYTANGGIQMFYNVIVWNIGSPPTLYGDLVEEEDFESPEDYSFVEPGYGESTFSYLVTSMVTLPARTDEDYQAILRFSHCLWTRNRAAGCYLEISEDSVVWTQVPDSDLLDGYYHQQTTSDFPGGIRDAWIFKSIGYNPAGSTLSIEEADIEAHREDSTEVNVWFRWVFGVEDKASNNQDGWILDDPMVLLVDRDTTAMDSIRLDLWDIDTLPEHYLRFWKHLEFPTYNDYWCYHDIYAIDPIFPPEQGYAWTTWGPIGYIGPWSHGGVNDSWEIGTTAIWYPIPDPEPTVYNGSHYAGTDLTRDDGLYNPNEASYLLSERFEVDKIDVYEIIRLVIYRCNRFAPNDDGWIHFGFSCDTLPPDPMNLSEWFEVRRYEGENHFDWEVEDIITTDVFVDEGGADSTYYWILFTIISGPTLERGGWNLDNIQIYGDYFI